MEWKKIQGSQPEKPLSVQVGRDYVFLRKNIHTYTEADTEDESKVITGWEYDEMLLTKDQYEEFVKITGNPFYISDTEDIQSRITSIETFIATSTES